eukprot:TRINITY_DN27432_c0_g1_i1.p1 TRINITY_DN27432_c0_g1~~TRINITY_DN27432_c0_g1_i1.p1  ORF type:complete len:322 (+),score=23.90 TRINITY_DN27432_c0_g1_i1:49-966(+)
MTSDLTLDSSFELEPRRAVSDSDFPSLFSARRKNSRKPEEQYQNLFKLGEGTFSQVYAVRHKEEGTTYAIKMVNKGHPLYKKFGLKNEVKILRRLDHPNIIQLKDTFEDQRHLYLVTDICQEGCLFDEIERRQKFTECEAAKIMGQLLSATAYFHSKSIVHRDLKPENILFGSNSEAKIIDFGTASYLKNGKVLTKKIGTSYYISPEVIDGEYTEKCDIWSLGVILFILLSGKPPFWGKNDIEILSAVKRGGFCFRTQEWDDISTEAKSLVRRMLTYNPYVRISAREALADSWISRHFSPKQVQY